MSNNLNIEKLSLEIYNYDKENQVFSYDLNTEITSLNRYKITADYIKIIRMLREINIQYDEIENKTIKFA